MRDPRNSSHADSNHYALPLPLSPVICAETWTLVRIDILPTGKDSTIKDPAPLKLQPPNEYTPEHQSIRTDLKPLNVVQPEGTSFKVTKAGETGEIIQWQKWSFRIGFNAREGMVIYNVRRTIFIREVD
jgi:primary-amine oxidase